MMSLLFISCIVQKSAIVEEILNWAQKRADKELKKTDGNRRNRYVL